MVKIEQIIEQNKWWSLGLAFRNSDLHLKKLDRSILKIKRRELKSEKGKVWVIYGPRQVGKTTFIKQRIEELIQKDHYPAEAVGYFSCDALTSNSRKELRTSINYFLEKLRGWEKAYLFIDEISNVPDWIYEIKYIIDQNKLGSICLVLTGSPLGLKEKLPGRPVEEYFMKPLTFRDFVENICSQINEGYSSLSQALDLDEALIKELLNLKNFLKDSPELDFQDRESINKIEKFHFSLNHLFKIYLCTGGFPSPINKYLKYQLYPKTDQSAEEAKTELEGEYDKIISQLLDSLIKRGLNENIIRQILYNIIEKLPSRYSFGAIRGEEGLSLATIISYLNHLEDIFFIKIIYTYNFRDRTIAWKKPKKIYLIDPFVYYSFKKFITGKDGLLITQEILNNEEASSAVAENLVGVALAQTKEEPFIRDINTFLWFWYSEKKEIDFIYKNENYLGLEVKYQRRTEKLSVIPEVTNYLVITREDLEYKGNVTYLPIHLFLFLVGKGEKHL